MEPVFEFPLSLGSAGRGGLARELHGQLRAAILDRRLLPGAQLPATRRVAATYGIARNTVIAAYDLLMAEGYVLTRAGAKAQVADLGARAKPPRGGRSRTAGERLNAHWRRPLPAVAAFTEYERTPGFRLGTPEYRYLPLEVWRRLLTRALTRRLPAGFEYPHPHGHPLLRTAIAQHVSFTRAVACSAEDVIVTSGAQQAFDLLARALVTAGRTRVAVEDPGYPPLRAAMAAAGAQLLPVQVDEQGLRVERLPETARVVYVTPSHQFPTGVAMSMPRRAALLAFARAHGAVIIEDDYDGEFRYGVRPLDALQTLDREASVLYVGTFSKSLFPALRIGYIVAPPWARAALISVKWCADTGVNAQLQDALGHFIVEGHLARYVRRMRKVYAERRRALLAGLEDLQSWLEPLSSEAGIHLAARCRERAGVAPLLAQLRRHAPGARPLSHFAMSGGERAAGVVFGFGCIEAEAIGERLAALAQALRRDQPGRRVSPAPLPL